ATKIGEGYDTGATGCPILVDGYLFTYAGKEIVKMDVISGQVVARGEMAAASSFAINSPTYAEGMLFVGLGGGRVQAFNAKTLESLWLYTDPKGGQPNCSIKYHKGYIYTGFWTAENKPANFVCIPVTDEDPSQTTEAKAAAWRYTHNGFYWAGAYTGDDFILVGTDDGENGYSIGHASVLSFDTNTGRLIEEMKLPGVGDLRSDIMYDEYGTGDYYFTTKGGYIYRLQVNGDGTFKNLMSLKLDNYSGNDATPPMSTSTPVVYNGRAYIGVSGEGQFGAYSGHNITVIDLASWSIAYKVRTQGYPQTSGLLTTAYEEESGYVYVYFIDNYTPGKLRILADKPGQKAPLLTTAESGYETAKVLFTPTGKQVQYAICSPIADENGVIYFKNDSAHMMALGPAIEKIEVTQLPDKTEYVEGESFEPSGMVVMATYTNKTQKDITNYISYSKEPLRREDQEFIITFPYVMYQDKEGQTGVEYPQPMTSVSLKIRSTEADLSKEFWVEGIEDYDYTGKAVLQQNMVVYHENSELIPGKDYTVKYKNNKNAGTAAVIITGKGNYTGSISKEFQIRPLDLSQALLKEEVVVLAYNRKVQKAVTEVSYQLSGKNIKLKAGTDFTYEYPETDKGAYQEPNDREGYVVQLKGKGNYTGEKIFFQKITTKTLLSNLTLSKIPDQKYNEIENPEAGVFPQIILKDKEGKVLSYRMINEIGSEEPQSDTQEYDFTAEYRNHQKVGTATVILKAVEGGKYSGTRTATFKITGSSLSKAKITDFNKTVDWSEEAYTQEGIQQNIKVEYTFGSGKNKQVMALEENKDYTVAYSNNKEIGTATLILT
ncbi:MAG: hypothetical protein IKW28_01980, partial [Lachnospiraceae bacterium]|nr:hypothetical protein [Lachnospiraceae bacterium]